MGMPAWTEADLERVVARGQVRIVTAPTQTRLPRTPPPAPVRLPVPTDRYRSQTERRFVREDRYRSKLERRYAQYLDVLQHERKIERWDYESIKLRLGEQCSFTPDFLVIRTANPSVLEFHETKGFWRDDALVKMKVAAERYTYFVFYSVEYKKNTWIYTRF